MRFLFVGGGTGGHLTPALGLAEALGERGHACLFLLEGRAVESAYFRDGPPARSLGVAGRGPRAWRLLRAGLAARRAAAEFGPDLVVALGGAASSAALGVRGRPRVQLEGNFVAGRAVRWMAPLCRATLTMYRDTAEELRRGFWMGPVRRDALAGADPHGARARLGLDPHKPVLLVTGGSQGAAQLNDFAARLVPELAARDWQLLALCGPGKAETLRRAVASAGGGLRARVCEHCDTMGDAYAAAEFALTRGGASTVGELWERALPALVVPYPWHRDRQQEHNVRALEPGLRAVSALDDDAVAWLLRTLDDSAARAAMGASLRAQAPPDGRARGARLLEEIAGAPR